MLTLLIDEGLPPQIAEAFCALDWPAYSIGGNDAPPRGSTDETNCKWCAEREAVLVTNDHGKKDPNIHNLLNQHHVHAVFVPESLKALPTHELAMILLKSCDEMHRLAERRLLKHHLRRSGKLTK